jgi:hypothetical protein
VQQHLGRLDGVAKVDVNLLDGKVAIFPKPDSAIDPALVLKATYDSGVSVGEMTMTASGRLVRDAQKGLLFRIAVNQSFELAPNELSLGLEELAESARQVTLRGRLYKKPPGKQKSKTIGPLRFEILEVLRKD